jgi:hypothetical protein
VGAADLHLPCLLDDHEPDLTLSNATKQRGEDESENFDYDNGAQKGKHPVTLRNQNIL